MNPAASQPTHITPDEARRTPHPEQNRRRWTLLRHLITSLILFAVFIAGLIITVVSGLHTSPPEAFAFASTPGTTLRGTAINATDGVRLVSWDTPTPPPNTTAWPSSYGVWYQWPDRSWRHQPAPVPTGWPTSWPSDRQDSWPTDWSTQPPTGWPAPQQDGWPTDATWPPSATSVANTPAPPNGYWPGAAPWPASPNYLPKGAGDGKLACPTANSRDGAGRGGAVGMRIDVTVADPPGRDGAPARGPMIVGCGPAGQLQVAVCAANPNYGRTSQSDRTAPGDNRSHRNSVGVDLGLADRVDNIVDSALDTALGATSKADSATSKADSDTDSADRHRRHSKHERGSTAGHSSHRDSRWDYDDVSSTDSGGKPSQKWICPSTPGR